MNVNFVMKWWCFWNVNFDKNVILKMWILSKMRFWTCEFFIKMRFQKCEFCQKWEFENVNFRINWEFPDQWRIFAPVWYWSNKVIDTNKTTLFSIHSRKTRNEKSLWHSQLLPFCSLFSIICRAISSKTSVGEFYK